MENKPRKPWLAGLLSLFQPGLGQIYNGEPGKACIYYGISSLASLGMIPCLHSGFVFVFLAGYFVFVVAFYGAAISDSVRTARRYAAEYVPRGYNKAVVYLGVILLVTVLNLFLAAFVKSNFVQAYKSPSASMEPTILIGDQMLVDRSQAGRTPKRGEVTIFQYPEDPAKDFVKRVVAVAGDRVEVRNKVLYINGVQAPEPFAAHWEADIMPAEMNPRDNMARLVVPADSYFMLGDNRDRSYDSRFFGCVPRDKVKGTVKGLYWSWDKKTCAVRWDRIGREVR